MEDVSLLSALLTSNSWKFNPKYKKECKTLRGGAARLCANHTWIDKFILADGSEWWKTGLCNGFLKVLVHVYLLLQDCRYSHEPTFEYTASDFWSLWLELFWYEKLVESPNSQSSAINGLDTICLRDDMYAVLQTQNSNEVARRTRHSCEILGDERFTFKKYIREGNYDRVGAIREVVMKGHEGCTFASKSIDLQGLCEIDIHLKVNHPNVVRFKAWCQTSIVPFLVMELMDKDLRAWVQEQHPLNGKVESKFQKESWFHWDYMVVAIDILHQVAQAMRYVHACNVAHRDLKADNILVREELYEGRPMSFFLTAKLADFGASKQKEDRLFTTARIGTRQHRAPEVMKADDSKRKYSPQADVWSFGVLAWEVITGQLPAEKDGKAQKWPKQQGWIHPYLVGCIQSCWEAKPGKRPTFESICILMQNLKRTMFRSKGIYHASAFILADKSPSDLANEYQKYQKDLDKWWMNILISGLRPSKSPFHFNPQGCDPHKVTQFLNSLCKGSLGQTSFIICRCFSPASPQNGIRSPSMLSSSFGSSMSNGNGCSINSVDGYDLSVRFDWIDDHPVAQELCSSAALSNAASIACSLVEDTVVVGTRELTNSIHIFFGTLTTRLHQRRYCCQTCPSNQHSMVQGAICTPCRAIVNPELGQEPFYRKEQLSYVL